MEKYSEQETETSSSIRMEIPISVLARVLEEGKLSAADFRCLDGRSKQQVWRLCLAACVRRR